MSSDLEPPPYKVYRAAPRGLRARLRGEEEALLPRSGRPGKPGPAKPRDAWSIAKRVLMWVAIAVAGWLLLSFVLFIISAVRPAPAAPGSAKAALTSGPNMLTSDRHDPDPRHRPPAEAGGVQGAGRQHERDRQPVATRSCCGASAAASRAGCRSPATRSRRSPATGRQDQRGLRVRRGGLALKIDRAVHRAQDQPRDRRQPRHVPPVHRRDRRRQRSRPAGSARTSAAARPRAASR